MEKDPNILADEVEFSDFVKILTGAAAVGRKAGALGLSDQDFQDNLASYVTESAKALGIKFDQKEAK